MKTKTMRLADRFYPAEWDNCAHDQNGDDPDIAPCSECGLLIEFIPGASFDGTCSFAPVVFLISEEPV